MITTALIGRTYSLSPGAETSRPSTAERTEIAGVMTPSPKNKQAPAMPTSPTVARMAGLTQTRWASAMSARMPPSPRLSARITSMTYFTVTIRISDQKIRERMPRISVSEIRTSLNSIRLALKA